jgi:hypothetical protein
VLLGAVLAVTNGSTLTAGAAVSSNGGGESLCFGTVAVPQWAADTESIIDQSANLVVHTIGTGANPWSNTYSGDGRYLFISEYSGESIRMIDTSNNQLVRILQLGEFAGLGFVSNNDGSIIWTATQDATSAPHVREIQTSDGSVIASIDGFIADDLLLSPDGNTIWMLSVNYPKTVVVELDAATLTLTSSTSLPLYYHGATLNSTGSILYIADDINPGIGIAAFDTQSKSYTTLGPTIGIHSVAISPSDSTLYFVGGESGSYFLYILDIAAGTWTQHLALASTTAGGWVRGSRVTADGSKLFITNDYYAQGGLVVVETANPDTATFIPMQVSAPVAVCPLLADPAAPTTTTSTTTAATDPVAPAFTG